MENTGLDSDSRSSVLLSVTSSATDIPRAAAIFSNVGQLGAANIVLILFAC